MKAPLFSSFSVLESLPICNHFSEIFRTIMVTLLLSSEPAGEWAYKHMVIIVAVHKMDFEAVE